MSLPSKLQHVKLPNLPFEAPEKIGIFELDRMSYEYQPHDGWFCLIYKSAHIKHFYIELLGRCKYNIYAANLLCDTNIVYAVDRVLNNFQELEKYFINILEAYNKAVISGKQE